ncbi:MAG: hypothetical protein HC812_00755 [Leptolyngbya sp. RL_3_1]|nr:hypothetical protein [Leptolyngbya sp. RL_3_1]
MAPTTLTDGSHLTQITAGKSGSPAHQRAIAPPIAPPEVRSRGSIEQCNTD